MNLSFLFTALLFAALLLIAQQPTAEAKLGGFSTVWETTLQSVVASFDYGSSLLMTHQVPNQKDLFVFNDKNDTFHAINTSTGSMLWSRYVEGCRSNWSDGALGIQGFAVGAHVLGVFCTKFHGLDIKTGAILYEMSDLPVLGSEDNLFQSVNPLEAFGPDYTRAFVLCHKDVRVIELATGDAVWKREVKKGFDASHRFISNGNVAFSNLLSADTPAEVLSLANGSKVWSKVFSDHTKLRGMQGNFAAFSNLWTGASEVYDFTKDERFLHISDPDRGIGGLSVVDDMVVVGVAGGDDWFVEPRLRAGYVLGVDVKSRATIFNQTFSHALLISGNMQTRDGRVFTTMGEAKNFTAATQSMVVPTHFVSFDMATGKPFFDVQVPTSPTTRFLLDDRGNMIIPNPVGLAVIDSLSGKPKSYSLNYPGLLGSSVTVLGDGRLMFAQANKVVCVKYDV